MKKCLLPLLLMTVIAVTETAACIVFKLSNDETTIYASNFDWSLDCGSVVLNPRNIRKNAFVPPPAKPLSWVASHASVTFNQFSREVPISGMNEKGLVIVSLVAPVQYPGSQKKGSVNELQWVQYHLDRCSTVDEVIKSAGDVPITLYAVTLHYFVADSSGKCAAIDFVGGKPVVRTGKDMPSSILANQIYDVELKSKSSNSRFDRTARMIKRYDGNKDIVEYSCEMLDKVAQGKLTKWQIVFDVSGQKIHFRSLKGRKMKRFWRIGMMRHITPGHIVEIKKVIASCKMESEK